MQRARITEIRVVEGLATGYTANGDFIVPLVLDYGVWTERGAVLIDVITNSTKGREAKTCQIWVTGQVSPRAVEELQGENCQVEQDAWPKLYPGAESAEEVEDKEG